MTTVQSSEEQAEKLGDPDEWLTRLHERKQIGLMRRLAKSALAAYDLPPARLTLLFHLFNTTFRVDTDTGERYVLRIHRFGTPTVQTVGSELAWLAALHRDTHLEVPDPVPTRAGPLLTVASVPDVPRSYICVLFRWMSGRLVQHRQSLTAARMERVGELMAHLQNHSIGWERPPGFVRGRVDWPVQAARWEPDPFAPRIIASIERLVADSLSVAEAHQVTDALERVREVEQALAAEQEQPTFGLLHADLHYGNLLFSRGVVRAIDFDDCGFGPLLYDPAVMLSEILHWQEYPGLRAALLAGYRRWRPLSARHEAYLDAFVALRVMQDGLWVLQSRKHPAIGEDWATQARSSLSLVPALVQGTALRLD